MNYYRNEQLEHELLSEMMDSIEDNTRIHPSVTDLIYCLTKTWLQVNKPVEHSRQTKLYFAIGLGLERNLLAKRQANEPVLLSKDGISFHPDSDTQLLVSGSGLIEMKSTRYNVTTKTQGDFTPDRFPEGWIKQGKAYCYALGVDTITFVPLHIIQADLRAWTVTWDRQELEDNWQWLLDRRKVWVQADKTGEAPASYQYHMDWECKECPRNLWCQVRSGLI